MKALGRLSALFLMWVLGPLPSGSGSPPAVQPGPGVFLVARPKIEEGLFHHSVVLLLSHGDEGTLGLIINRATEVHLSEALPDLKADGVEHHALFIGGPVSLDGLLFLFRSDQPPGKVAHVMGNVYFSGDRKVLEELLKGKQTTDRLKTYVGHSGWSPGQLQTEIARGDWDVVRADAFTVFQKNPDQIWPELSHNGGVVADAASGAASSQGVASR